MIPANKQRKRKAIEDKILASLFELSLDGVAPSLKGLKSFLTGEDAASQFDGLSCFGVYASFSNKRLGRLLKSLDEEGYLEALERQEERYFVLRPIGKLAAQEYLNKDHKKRARKEKAPYFLPLK